MQKQNPDELALICRGFFINNKELYVRNYNCVKFILNKWGYKMGELIERGKNLRKFLYFTLTVLFVVYPTLSIINNVVNYCLHK